MRVYFAIFCFASFSSLIHHLKVMFISPVGTYCCPRCNLSQSTTTTTELYHCSGPDPYLVYTMPETAPLPSLPCPSTAQTYHCARPSHPPIPLPSALPTRTVSSTPSRTQFRYLSPIPCPPPLPSRLPTPLNTHTTTTATETCAWNSEGTVGE